MGGFRVRVEGVDRVARRYGDAGRIVQGELVELVDRLTTHGEAFAKRQVGKDTRHLMRSTTKTPARRSGRGARGDFGSNAPYAEVHDKGRRPGAAMPPKGVLLGWMRRHGIPAEREFVVRRAIGRRGIPANRFLTDALADVRRRAPAETRRAVARIAARLGGR